MSTISIIQQMDRGLKRYYEHRGAPYFNEDGVGKFAEWIDENGYDSEGVREEFEQQPHEIAFIDFDDNFPLKDVEQNKIQSIFQILHTCYVEPTAFFNSPDLPNDEETQLKMAVNQSLVEIGSVPQTTNHTKPPKQHTHPHYKKNHSDIDRNEPHISYVENTQKPHSRPYGHMHRGMYNDEQDPDFYSDENDENYIINVDGFEYNKKYKHNTSQRDKHRDHKNKQYIAKDAIYESQFMSAKLEISSVKDTTQKQLYQEALNLQNIADRALHNGEYKIALKHYSQMFICLGCKSVRRLHDFCSNDGAINPVQKAPINKDNIYTAMDKLRIFVYIQMAFIYIQQQQWNKVIDKCSQALENDDNNIKALLYRGRAYQEQKKFEEAEADLMKAKNSNIVDLEIEMELNALKRNKDGKYDDDDDDDRGISSFGGNNASFTSFTNNNWPSLPLRNITLELWLKSKSKSTKDVPYEMLYPDPLKKNRYKLYENQEMLDMSVIWLDVDFAERFINLQIFDINKQEKTYSFQSYLHRLCSGKLCNGATEYRYAYNRAKFVRLLTVLCDNQDIALELRDDEQRTALALAVKYDMMDLGLLLLQFGANVNDGSVKQEIQQKGINKRNLMRKKLHQLRITNLEAIQYVLSMDHGVEDSSIYMKILDFCVSAWIEKNSVVDID